MRAVVLDASVIVEALTSGQSDGAAERAEDVWLLAATGHVPIVQPPHWLAEVTGVLARVSPQTAEVDAEDLYTLNLPEAGDLGVYTTAVRLSIDLGQHLFDTLYHAVALERGALLVTGDRRYLRTSGRVGGVVAIDDFNLDLLE
ncbi:MAG TPA: type II toxin-antitoxin system VapC family toxin [Longimicrobiales bacterium]|nr:type II toxin-antitoxin system VapC family toxin [Longimicrobiales bacterium]